MPLAKRIVPTLCFSGDKLIKDRRFAVQAADGSCAHVAVRSAWDASANARVFELELVPEVIPEVTSGR